MITVRFKHVGRGRLSWEQEFKAATDVALARAIRKKKALASNGIDFEWDNDEASAKIIVGGFRVVGTLDVVDP